ncbi:MAG: UDP-N-acetylmuramyl-tripeptide synthetase [Parcubacteria group bacterium]|nr:UDP-N-acetylmuramyl-tripeptide synthetase [Parcubacteria group bacterium]MCR4342779.1 UDP-N-acetylmuramyl-tripeptide synthetase [Patescibacteria group bacterium]
MFDIDKYLRIIRKIIPIRIFKATQPAYHFLLAFFAALVYRFPSRKIFVLGITGTKGKTSTLEIANAILEKAGYKTALSSTLRFKVRGESENNLMKMTMPGRFFTQKFLRKAVKEKCQYALLEITSEGAKQFRHKFISLDALIFTNLTKEHIESHGSFEAYRDAKLKIAKALERSKKKRRIIIANSDDENASRFLNIKVPEKISYSIKDGEPFTLKKNGIDFTFKGEKISTYLSGGFNLYNILSASSFAFSQSVGVETIKKAIEEFKGTPGRMEEVDEGQDFTVVVDYAHTADSLEKVYEVFQNSSKICVLGSTGGGRDKWKRPELGRIADNYCQHIILTNEDPYDEDPKKIVEDVAVGIKRPVYEIIMDRREAIRKALSLAKTGDTVIITGKGTDPYIMGLDGTKLEWSDSKITREELKVLLNK